MSEAMVLTEDEALELVAFLVTAARTQVNEPNEYAPLRLLTAARKLGDFIYNRVSSDTQQLLAGPLKQTPATATFMSDHALYIAQLDSMCSAVAGYLVKHFGLERGSV